MNGFSARPYALGRGTNDMISVSNVLLCGDGRQEATKSKTPKDERRISGSRHYHPQNQILYF